MKAAKRFKTQEREKNQVCKEKSLMKKNKKNVSRKKLLMLHLKVMLFSINDVIPEVVLSEVSKLIDSVTSKR